jgi:Phasin protein
MTKEKSQGNELSAVGKQTMARAYSAMDYYFDHLKETIASAPSGGTEFGEKVKASAEQNISATQEYVRELTYAKDIQDILRIQTAFVRSQIGGVWRAGKRPRRDVYQSGIWSNHKATPGTVMHDPLLLT